MQKHFKTTKLHYNKYLYKLVLYNRLNSIFRTEFQRGGKLTVARENLDKLSQLYNANMPLALKRFRTTVEVNYESFLDAKEIYTQLKKCDDYLIRINNWSNMTIYSNDYQMLKNISSKMRDTKTEFWSPEKDFENFLINNENIIIVDEEPELEYKITLGRKAITNDLAKWLKANPDKSKVGKIALSELEHGGYVNGFYFYVRDSRVLTIIEMLVGHNIRRVDKLVYKGNIDK